MSKIGQNGSGPAGFAPFPGGQDGGLPQRGRPGDPRRPADLGLRQDLGRSSHQTGSDHGPTGHDDPRAALFRHHIERATERHGGTGDHAGREHDRHDTRVLAEAGAAPVIPAAPPPAAAPAPAAAPGVASAAPAASDPKDRHAEISRRVAGMTAWVDHALNTEVLPVRGGEPMHLSIPLENAAAGVTSLTLVATAEGLDITLVRNADEPDAALAGAAAELAETIQKRVGKRVRVLDRSDKPQLSVLSRLGGMAAFSAMLAPSGAGAADDGD